MKNAAIEEFNIEKVEDGKKYFCKMSYVTPKGLIRFAAFVLPASYERVTVREFVNNLRDIANKIEADLEENYDREPEIEDEDG
jgi:hypothetical protein